jgi:ABC-type phosphate transport system substrate-binding protein
MREFPVKAMTKVLVAIACLLGVSMLAPTAYAATDVPFTDDNTTKVHSAGSDTTYFLLNDLALLYNESEGCFQTSVALPLLPASPKQMQCTGATTPESAATAAQNNTVKTENYDHDYVINWFPQGSSAGRRQLCGQLGAPDGTRDSRLPPVDFARSSSGPGEGFQCTGASATVNGTQLYAGGLRVLRFVAFARDALTWSKWTTGTGASTAVTNLTQAQLNGIFVTCTITNWNQVGGGNAAIRVWTVIPAAGTRASWDTFVGGNSDTCIPAAFKDGSTANGERVIREHFAAPVEEAVNDPDAADEGNSIYPFGTGPHATSPGQAQNSILGSVNGIAPTGPNIVDGSFPFTRLLYNVFIQSGPSPLASEATRRFTNMRNYTGPAVDQQLGWLCKPEAAHSEPIGTPGAGIETAFASVDYGPQVTNTLLANGVYPLTTSETAPRCQFADYRVDQTAQTPI